jgi:hypothetical protein
MTTASDTSSSASQFAAIRHDIIKELFLKTADQTYVVARWCVLNRLYLDFYWNAALGLERLVKAVLLMNGQSSKAGGDGKPYSHDIVKLYEAVRLIGPTLLPVMLTQPTGLHITRYDLPADKAEGLL